MKWKKKNDSFEIGEGDSSLALEVTYALIVGEVWEPSLGAVAPNFAGNIRAERRSGDGRSLFGIFRARSLNVAFKFPVRETWRPNKT